MSEAARMAEFAADIEKAREAGCNSGQRVEAEGQPRPPGRQRQGPADLNPNAD